MNKLRFWHVFLLMFMLFATGIGSFACDTTGHSLEFSMGYGGVPQIYWVTWCTVGISTYKVIGWQ